MVCASQYNSSALGAREVQSKQTFPLHKSLWQQTMDDLGLDRHLFSLDHCFSESSYQSPHNWILSSFLLKKTIDTDGKPVYYIGL